MNKNCLRKESNKKEDVFIQESVRNETISNLMNDKNISNKKPFSNIDRNSLCKEKIIQKNFLQHKFKYENLKRNSQDFEIAINLRNNNNHNDPLNNQIKSNENVTEYEKIEKNNNLMISLDEEKLQEEKLKLLKKFSFCKLNFANNHVLSENNEIKKKNKKSFLLETKKKENKYFNKKHISTKSNYPNMKSIDLNNEISFGRECSKIILTEDNKYEEIYTKDEENYIEIMNKNKSNSNLYSNKEWKIIEFDVEKHNKIMEKFLNKNTSQVIRHTLLNFDKMKTQSNFQKFENKKDAINHNTNEKIDKLIQSSYKNSLNFSKKSLNESKNENIKYQIKSQSDFNQIKNCNLHQYRTSTSLDFKDTKDYLLKTINNVNLDKNINEKIKLEDIENIMKRVLDKTKKEDASKGRDFLKNMPQNYMNLGISQKKFYINLTKNEKPTENSDNNYNNEKSYPMHFHEFNLSERHLWKKHEDFWANLTNLGKDFIGEKIKNFNIDIQNYIFPPNDEEILLSYFWRLNNIDEKFSISENFNNSLEEINKWKNAYKKVVMRWHPDKLNPILDSIKIKEDLKIRLNKKVPIFINNMNKNLKFVVGLIKKIIIKNGTNKNQK